MKDFSSILWREQVKFWWVNDDVNISRLNWIFIVVAHWNNNLGVHMLLHSDTCYSSLTHVAPLWHMLLHSDTCYSTLTHVTPLWHMLLHSDTCYSTLTHVTPLWHMLLHSDTCYSTGTLTWFCDIQCLLLLLNSASLAEQQQLPIV
jgi:hypothetical protein